MAAERSRRAKVVTRPRWVRRTKQVFAFLGILFVFCFAAALAIYFPIYRDAVSNVQTIDSKLVVSNANPSEIVSADGQVLYSISLERRTVKDVDELPAYVRYAMVAAEDRRFYDHRGVDYVGLLRAGFVALRDRHASQGASTIEMQLAKKLVNGDEHSMTRKLKDAATAQEIEKLKTKNEILNLYMNVVYFGEGAYGIEAAAETYFRKHARDLSIAEAAMLARCVRSPSKDNPIRDYQGSIDRRDYVLGVMDEEHWITDDQYRSAVKEVPKLNPDPPEGAVRMDPDAGYFVDHVLHQFKEDFPDADLQSGGYRIVTNLNYRLQRDAVAAVRKTLADPLNREHKVNNAAFLLMNSDGRILAEVGGPNYNKSKWNVIVQDKRQPGSAFKAFLYAAALKDGTVHMGELISNEPISEEVNPGVYWTPRNNGRDTVGGSMDLTSAFAKSYNLPAIHTIQAETPQSVVKYAHDIFGFQSHLYAYDSLAIGTSEVSPLEMAAGYSVFMNNGDRVEPFPIARVIGPDGSILKEYLPQRYTGVLDSSICADLDSMMEAVVQHGTGTAARDVPNARGKTGTTQDAKDAWFCGYSDGLLGVGWVGHTAWVHHKARALPMASSVYGGTVTCGMWADIMMSAHRLGLQKAPAAVPVIDRPAMPQTVAKTDKPDPGLKQQDPDTSAMPDPSQDTAPQAPNPAPGPNQVQPNQLPPQTAPQPDQPAATKVSAPAPSVPPARTVSRPVAPKKDDDADYVEVEVCADTGMRASIYCPETVMRRFKRGTEPKETCRLHTGG